LQLEFKTVRMHQLWQWLPALEKEVKPDSLPAETDLWSALEQFKFNAAETINIRNQHSHEARPASFEQLMSAFYQYKQQQAHE
jgi:osmoprotectant transport system ATP-binding protein